jgi:hypothetical protein
VKSFGVEDVVARACNAAFGKPLVTNVLRGQVVEAMVALAIEPAWRLCSADYSSWDFERADGCRLEVKQSSYLQTWAAPAHGKVSSTFDIAARKGRWEGASWIEEPGRAAHLYLFAYHDVRDEIADHRDPKQWEFFVAATKALPSTKRISLGGVRAIASPVGFGELLEEVTRNAKDLKLGANHWSAQPTRFDT